MKKITDKAYKKKAKFLRDNKLIDNIDLRGKVSQRDKRRIQYYAKKHRIVLKHIRSGKFIRRFVSPERAKQMKALDYPVKGRHVWINTEGHDQIHIKGDVIEKRGGRGLPVKVLLKTSAQILEYLETNPTLKAHERMSAQIGNNSFWNLFDDPTRLLNYIVNQFVPSKDSKNESMESRLSRKENLISKMQIVEIN